MEENRLKQLIVSIEQTLLSDLKLNSVDHGEPIRVVKVSAEWQLLGAGNYAAVFASNEYPEMAVKVYAPNREGWESECEVYSRIGDHPAYSACYHAAEHQGHYYLILKRLEGKTLYQCVIEGKMIPAGFIDEIDQALDYARSRGLYPHDVHGKNIMLSGGRAIVVDISDFLKAEPCTLWDDLKKAYNHIYMPFLSKKPRPVPEWMMNSVRKGYRMIRPLGGRST